MKRILSRAARAFSIQRQQLSLETYHRRTLLPNFARLEEAPTTANFCSAEAKNSRTSSATRSTRNCCCASRNRASPSPADRTSTDVTPFASASRTTAPGGPTSRRWQMALRRWHGLSRRRCADSHIRRDQLNGLAADERRRTQKRRPIGGGSVARRLLAFHTPSVPSAFICVHLRQVSCR